MEEEEAGPSPVAFMPRSCNRLLLLADDAAAACSLSSSSNIWRARSYSAGSTKSSSLSTPSPLSTSELAFHDGAMGVLPLVLALNANDAFC